MTLLVQNIPLITALQSDSSPLMGEVYVRTLPKRTKGTTLDVVIGRMVPVGTMAQLPPSLNDARSLPPLHILTAIT